MSTPISRVMGNAHEVAMGLARRHNLVCDNGEVVCWECRERLALMPSLHCGSCLGEAYSRLNITDPQCVNVAQRKKEQT